MGLSNSSISTPADPGAVKLYVLMSHLGIEPGAGVVPQFAVAYSAAVRRCRACQANAACDAWLAEAAGRHFPGFCPNADILSELQFDRLPLHAAATAALAPADD